MKKFLGVLVPAAAVVFMFSAVSLAGEYLDFFNSLTPQQQNEYLGDSMNFFKKLTDVQKEDFLRLKAGGKPSGSSSVEYDPDYWHPVESKIDPSLKEGVPGGNIITPSSSTVPQTSQPSQRNSSRRWQTWDAVQYMWHPEAKLQLTNWTFNRDMITVQLVDAKGNIIMLKDNTGKVFDRYTLYPVDASNPNAGYQFGQTVGGRTQIVVPEGCQIYADSRYVNRSGNPAVFNESEIVYFMNTDPGPGFTIFPYHSGVWRNEIGR